MKAEYPIIAVHTKCELLDILKSLMLRLLMIAFSLAITLVLLEIAARLIPLWPDQISDFDPELGFAHIPGAEGWWVNINWPFEFRTYVSISSQGLHDREFDAVKPVGVKRILLLGDSLVDGVEVPFEETSAKQLERLLREAGQNVEVINGGHYGYGTDQELLFYHHRGRQFHPDIVMLYFMTNDVESNLSAETLGPKPFFELGPDGGLQLKNFPVAAPVPPNSGELSLLKRTKQMLYTYSKVYRFTAYHVNQNLPALRSFLVDLGMIDQTGEAVFPAPNEPNTHDCSEPGWMVTRALILQLREEVISSGAEFVMVSIPDFGQFAPGAGTPPHDDTKWHNCTENLCLGSDLQCPDLFPVFRSMTEQHQYASLFYPRDGHPTAEGHRHIAEALYDYLSMDLP